MGAYDPRVARQGQTQVNLPNGFAPAPAAAVNGFAQQGPAPMPPQPNPMRQAVPQPGIPQGPMPGQGQPAPNPMLAGADMQQPGMPSMTDRLMSPMAQIGMGLMSASGPSLQPVNPMRGVMTGLNNAVNYQQQREADAADAAYRQEQLKIARAKLGQGTALQRDYAFLKKNGYTDEQAMAILKKGTTIDMGQGADVPTLREQLSKNEANEWGGYLTAATGSRALLNNLEIMEGLIDVAPQGPLQGRIAQTFPGFDSAGAAWQAQLSQMLPALKVPNSGAQSDKDLEVIERGAPSLINNPQANRLILESMRRKVELDMKRAEIIRAYQNGDPGFEDASAARRALSDLNVSIIDPEMRRLLMGVGAFGTKESRGEDVNASAIEGARNAIAAGADPEKVRQRLEESGVPIPEGLF